MDGKEQADINKTSAPSYISPLYKSLALWGLVGSINGLLLLLVVAIMLTPHGNLFNVHMFPVFGVLFLAMLLLFSFSLRWLLRYGKYIKLREQPWWKGIRTNQPKETQPPSGPS